MTDWKMLVEKWADRHNFPKFTSDEPDTEPDKPKLVTTTLKYLHAYRGEFTFDDHEKPWSTVARNLDITITNVPNYHGVATFHGGTVAITDNVPMWANMRARFTIDKSLIHLDRIDLESDGATSMATGDVDMTHWPEMTYQVHSRVHFQRMREIFFRHETYRLTGDGDFTGVFHLFKGGHDLPRHVLERARRRERLPLPVALRLAALDAGRVRRLGRGVAFLRRPRALHLFDQAARPARAAHVALRRVVRRRRSRGLHRLRRLPRASASPARAAGRNVLEWPLGRFADHRGDGHLVGHAAARRAGDDGVARRRRARPTRATPTTSGGRSRRCRSPRTCRSPAS